MISAALLVGVMPMQYTNAAGLETQIVVLFEGEQWIADTKGTVQNGVNYIPAHWAHATSINGNSVGLPGGGNVGKWSLNGSYNLSDGTVCTDSYIQPDKPLVFGVCFRNTNNWSLWTADASGVTETAMVSAKVRIDSADVLDLAYLYLNDTSNNMNYVGIKLSDFYSAADAGNWKTINIPLSAYVSGGEGCTSYTYHSAGPERNLDPSKINGGGFIIAPSGDVSEPSDVYLDDLMVCNVLAPTGLAAEQSDTDKAVLAWTLSDSSAAAYEIIRNGEVIGAVDGETSTYTDSGIEEQKTYDYQLRAVDRYGAVSKNTNSVQIQTSPIGVPQDLKGVSSFEDALRIHLSWTPPKYGRAYSYEIYRENKKIAAVSGNNTEYDDIAGLSDNTFYEYWVKAVSENGKSSMPSAAKRVFATYIGCPENVTASAGDEGITLSWDKVGAAAGYKIFRNGAEIAAVGAENCAYIDTGIHDSVAYTYYIVSAGRNGRESAASEKVIITRDEKDKEVAVSILEDTLSDGYNISAIGTSSYSMTSDRFAVGSRSGKISFTQGSFVHEGISFMPNAVLDLARARSSGDRIEFYFYAENAEMLENVKVGLACASDKFHGGEYTMRTGVELASCVEQYGYWNYASIPISALPAVGSFILAVNTHTQPFQFSRVTGIDFYIDEPYYIPEKSLYIDGLKLVTYHQPHIVSVSTEDGTEIASGDVISSAAKSLAVQFDTAMDPKSFEENVQLGTAERSIPVTCSYDEKTMTLTMTFAAGLQKSALYRLQFDGVRSAKNVVLTGVAYDFFTNDDADEMVFTMNDTEYVEFPSQSIKKGDTAQAKIMFASDEAGKTAVNGMQLEILYDSSVLSTSENLVKLPASIKNASVNVDNRNGKVELTLGKTEKTYIIGEYIANIAFNTLKAGGSTVTVQGTVEQADPVKTVQITQKHLPKISVSTYTSTGTGNTGGSGGGGRPIGGGRGEAAEQTNSAVSATDESEYPSTGETTGFHDAGAAHWAAEAIAFLEKHGIMKGYEDGSFRPDNEVTREEFAAMLVRAFLTANPDAAADFEDVSADEWYFPFVAAAAAAGIANGYEGRFGISETISRQDMCTMLVRTAEVCSIALIPTYNAAIFYDGDEIADYAAEGIRQLQTAGIVTGVGNNLFEPAGKVTRAMAAKVIYELYKLK